MWEGNCWERAGVQLSGFSFGGSFSQGGTKNAGSPVFCLKKHGGSPGHSPLSSGGRPVFRHWKPGDPPFFLTKTRGDPLFSLRNSSGHPGDPYKRAGPPHAPKVVTFVIATEKLVV